MSHSALFDPEDEGTTIFGNTRTYRPKYITPHPARFALVSRRVLLAIMCTAGSKVGRLGGYTNIGQELCQGASGQTQLLTLVTKCDQTGASNRVIELRDVEILAEECIYKLRIKLFIYRH